MTSVLSEAIARGCPTPGKVAFPDKKTAVEAIDLAQRLRVHGVARPKRRGVERRAYMCACGRWHLTSRERAKNP